MTAELVISVCASLPTHALIVGMRHSDAMAGSACCRWRRHAFKHHHAGPVQSSPDCVPLSRTVLSFDINESSFLFQLAWLTTGSVLWVLSMAEDEECVCEKAVLWTVEETETVVGPRLEGAVQHQIEAAWATARTSVILICDLPCSSLLSRSSTRLAKAKCQTLFFPHSVVQGKVIWLIFWGFMQKNKAVFSRLGVIQ